MKRNFVVGLFGGLVGFGMLFILLSGAGIVGARGADMPRDQARPGAVSAATPLTSTFTYQGQLKNGGNAVNGSCDMAFRLYDDPSAGNLIGSPITTTVSINGGFFTVGLNFGNSAFTGSARWLDIRVRCPAGSGSYTTLAPRQAVTAAPYALAPWVTSGNNLYYTAGNVGIVKSGATEPVVRGVPTGLKVGTPSGTMPLALRQDADESGTPGLAYFETGAGDLGYLGASPSTFEVGAAARHGLGFNVDGSVRAMTIDTFGRLGIGTTNPNATLDVNGAIQGASLTAPSLTAPANLFLNATDHIALRTLFGSLYAERVTIANNGNVGIHASNPFARLTVGGTAVTALAVYDNGLVQIGGVDVSSTTHACYNDGGFFAGCSSAAEYVPTIDHGFGFPETADLVSIAPAIKNPYDDEHSPFVVTKSTQPCDANLLGFIVKPESGADGEKKNEHYLPLAIYGYFPAKVMLENGAIKRGDPLTSSSKPGYAMKATSACKIIGYALEDADHEGTIQVFANHGENAASEVVVLRTQVQELKQTVADLKQQNVALDARLAALEQKMSGQAPTQSAAPRDVVVFGALFAIVGIVVGRRVDKRGLP